MTIQQYFVFLLLLLFVTTSVPLGLSAQEPSWWNPGWKYRLEIPAPFDTGKESAKFQPIDLPVTFDHPCWAPNEQNYSLRVIYQDGDAPVELESQIYDLNHTDETHIKTCNLVFIIPGQATGKEHYYVYYSEDETPSPIYPDHLHIEEAHYYFAPIPGFPFESYYYKITQEGNIVYGIAVNGQFLGVSTAQQITLFKNNITTVTTPQDSLAFASFDYFYYYGDKIDAFESTIQKLISKAILIDGNLMVSCGIVSETSKEDFRTTATYKYYYCPDPQNRRVYAHVKHEALKATQISPVPPYSESAGNIASFQVGAMKSPSIKELNFGQMFPSLDIYAQDNRTLDFPLDTNPDYTPEGITVINTQDNVDLGKKAWVCFDDGTSGFAHALIFGSTHVLVSGTGERDGIQIKAIEGAGPGLLGLRSTAQTFYCSRNSYEKGSANDLTVPADYVVEFDAEFYSSFTGGYPAVDNESTIYQAAIQTRPSPTGHVPGETQNQKTYTLKAFVYLTPSAPMGAALSLFTGRNFSYISAELYRENQQVMNDIAGRVSLSSIPSFEGATFLKKIKIALGFLDLRNFTIFKKIQFADLQPGTYLVKIYKEHPRFGHELKYIGFKIVDLEKNMTTRIVCGAEGHVDISIQDQQGTPVDDADARLLSGNITVAETKTTPDTSTTISAPSSLRGTYTLQLLYKGFLLYNKPVSLRPINSVFPRKISNDISLYDFTLDLKDLWGISPSETLNPLLTSSEMKEPVVLTAKPLENGQYLFEHLPPATYNLQVSYKSYLLQENITIPLQGSNMLTLVIPTEFNVTIITYDSRGLQLPKTTVTLERDEKTLTLNKSSDGRFISQLPPGTYTATVWYENAVVGKRTLTVIGERSFDLVTTEEPLFPLIVIGVTIAFGVIGAFLTLRKKDTSSFLKVLAGILAIVSLMLPWWTIQGSSIEPMVNTQTHLYFVPANLISFTTTPTVIAGERSSASAPALFTTFITFLTVAVLASALCIILQMIFHRYRRKKLSISFLAIGIALLTLSLSVFYIVMSVITKVGVGGVFGQGPISANIPGENILVIVSSSWGLDSGFYLCFTALILLCSSLLLSRKKHKNEVQEKAV